MLFRSCSFKKVPGVHVIILKRAGYETRSYTIQVDDDNRDTPYTFAELVANSQEEPGGEDGDSAEGDEGEQDEQGEEDGDEEGGEDE